MSIPETLEFFLLQHNDVPVEKYRSSALAHLVNTSRACIPVKWKSKVVPSIKSWLNIMNEIRWNTL